MPYFFGIRFDEIKPGDVSSGKIEDGDVAVQCVLCGRLEAECRANHCTSGQSDS